MRSGVCRQVFIALVFGLLLGGGPLLEALADDAGTLGSCDCLECLKLQKASTLAERQAYEDRLPLALQALNSEFIRWTLDQSYRDRRQADGAILFCELWSIYEDEVNVVRELEIPKIQKKIFANKMQCMPKTGGSTDPVECKIDDLQMAVNEVTSPCPEVHLAYLAHELVHVDDCEARKLKPDWLKAKGKSCRGAFAGKATPRPELMVLLAKTTFETELHAHAIEAQVIDLLSDQLAKQCRPNEDSNRRPGDLSEAMKYLERARTYEYQSE